MEISPAIVGSVRRTCSLLLRCWSSIRSDFPNEAVYHHTLNLGVRRFMYSWMTVTFSLDTFTIQDMELMLLMYEGDATRHLMYWLIDQDLCREE